MTPSVTRYPNATELPNRSPGRVFSENLHAPHARPTGVSRRGHRSNTTFGPDWPGNRCGAVTRNRASCRNPAMPNGRCRMHGGKSTGPRTEEGLERARKARWKHGHRSRRRSLFPLLAAMAYLGLDAFLQEKRVLEEVFGMRRKRRGRPRRRIDLQTILAREHRLFVYGTTRGPLAKQPRGSPLDESPELPNGCKGS